MAQIRVECPRCGFSAQLDASRIPTGGARIKCPKCKEQFTLPGAAVPAAAPPSQPAREQVPAPARKPAAVPVAAPDAGRRSGRDLRKHKRIPFAVDVLVNRASLMKAIDLSEGGVYVHTGRSFNPGSVIDVELPLGERKLTVKGRVQHNQSGIGMGIQFVELTGPQLAEIREFIASAGAGGKAAGATRKKVVLIDEDAMKRRMSKSKLMLEGCVVVDFEDPMEALRGIERELPDLVILDPFMKKMDGFKLLAIIRGSPSLREVPILAYASKGSDEIMAQAMAAGATEFHLKMMTPPAKLAEIVKRVLAVPGR